MALKLGTLYVDLTARTDGVAKGIADALKHVEKFTREVKKAANDAAQLGAGVAAIGLGALKLASDINGPAKAAMDDLHRSTQQLAVPLAQMLLPAVKALAADIRMLASHIAGMDPGVKAGIASAAKWAVELGGVALVVGKVAGLISSLSGVLSGVFAAVAAAGVGPILGIVAALGLAAAGVAALHAAYRTNFLGMGDATRRFWDFFGSTSRTVLDAVRSNLLLWVGKWLAAFGAILDAYANFQETIGNKGAADFARRGARGINNFALDALQGSSQKIVTAALDLGKMAGTAFANEWKRIFDELGISKLWDRAKSMFSGAGALAAVGPKGPLVSGAMSQRGFGRGALSAAGAGGAGELTEEQIAETGRGYAAAMARAADYFRQGEGKVKVALANIGAGLQVAGQIFLSKMGRVGEVINAAVQGFQAGGLWGALIAAVASLLTMTDGFGKLLGYLEATLGEIIKIFEPLIEAIAAFSNVMGPLKPILDLVGGALKIVGTIILGVAIGVGEIWNWIVDTLQLDKTWKIDNEANKKALADIWATDKHTAATAAATHELQKFTATLTNVPDGFKIGALSFAAAMAGAHGYDPNTVPGIGYGGASGGGGLTAEQQRELAIIRSRGRGGGGKTHTISGAHTEDTYDDPYGQGTDHGTHPPWQGKMSASPGSGGSAGGITIENLYLQAGDVDTFLSELERRARVRRVLQTGNPATSK